MTDENTNLAAFIDYLNLRREVIEASYRSGGPLSPKRVKTLYSINLILEMFEDFKNEYRTQKRDENV